MPNTLDPVIGSTILIKIGDGASPEVFSHPNVINMGRSVQITPEYIVDDLCDLDDQSLPDQKFRRVKSVDVTLSGSGKLNQGDTLMWLEWAANPQPKNVIATDGVWKIAGKFVPTFQIDVQDPKGLAECSMTLNQAGPVTVSEV